MTILDKVLPFLTGVKPNYTEIIKIGKKDYTKINCATIYIQLSYGEPYILFNKNITTKEELLKAWVEFYKWWFEENSPQYMFKYKDGETMVLRSAIISFTIKLEDHLVEV